MTNNEPQPADPASSDEMRLRFVEQLAFVFIDSGLPRMQSRVFAYTLAADDDDGRYTAAQLAEGLRVSPAAISGAVRSLVRIGLLAKERKPGSRSDHYRVYDDDIWSNIMAQRLPIFERYEAVLAQGVNELPPGYGADRLEETLDYIRFMHAEMREMHERWRKHREERRAERAQDRTARSQVGEQPDR